MRFDMKTPCQQCPFVKGSTTNRTLRKGRLEDIMKDVRNGCTFTCHKTLDQEKRDQQHCAGALIFIEKEIPDHPMIQIAERLGIYDRTGLNMDADIVEAQKEEEENVW